MFYKKVFQDLAHAEPLSKQQLKVNILIMKVYQAGRLYYP